MNFYSFLKKMTKGAKKHLVPADFQKSCGFCRAILKNGQHCGRRTCKTNLCWQHLQARYELRIKPSSIKGAGDGLFFDPNKKQLRLAREHHKQLAILRGQQITTYSSKRPLLTKEQYDSKYDPIIASGKKGETSYGFSTRTTPSGISPHDIAREGIYIMDGGDTRSDAGRFINHASVQARNAIQSKGGPLRVARNRIPHNKRVPLQATKKILPGQEIFLKYFSAKEAHEWPEFK
jgi:hypothetical protein